MSAGSENARAEELLQHASRVRRLARLLTRDPAEADDLVQDTWAAALAHPPPAGGSLLPWLNAVLRNFARRSRLRAARRPDVEAAAAGSAGAVDPADACEGLEAARLLTEELGGLEEPYRTALYLRYYQDLAPNEIARRQGLPAATVRSHLLRGIERLRGRLDRRFGDDRGSWCVLLAPLTHLIRPQLAATSTVAAGAATATGVLAMNTALKLGAALAVVAVSYLGLASSGVVPDALGLFAAREVPEPVSFVPLEPEPPGAGPVAAAPAPAERLPVEAAVRAAAPEAAASAAPNAPAASAAVVEAVIADARGVGLADASLTRFARDASAGPAADSGADGSVRLAIELDAEEVDAVVEASAPGYASAVETVRLRRGETVQLGTLRLAAGGAVRGVVVDDTGRGIEGALVHTEPAGGSVIDLELRRFQRTARRGDDPLPPLARTDPAGAFTLAGLAEEHVWLWAEAAGTVPAYTGPVEVRAGLVAQGIEIVLERIGPSNSVLGRVVGPDGEPVPRAELDYRLASGKHHFSVASTREAEEDGSFRFVLGAGSTLSLTARDPRGRLGPALEDGLAPGPEEVVLRLTGGPEIELVASGEGGERLAGFAFEVRAAEGGELLLRGHGQDGLAAFRSPPCDFLVEVTAPLHLARTLGPLAPTAVGDELEVRLAAAPGLRGRVLAGDAPVVGADVRLHRVVPDGDRLVHAGVRCWLDPNPVGRTIAGAAGEFVLSVPSAGEYVVQVEHAGHALAERGPFRVDPATAAEPLTIALDAGGAIEGRVRFATGADPTGTIVGIHRGDGRPRTVRVGADGVYRFELLTPGTWSVAVLDEEPAQDFTAVSTSLIDYEDEVEWSCEVFDGETTFHDLTVGDPRAYVIAGRIEIDGVESDELSVFACPPNVDFYGNAGGWPAVTPDAQGRFELGLAEPGEHRLVIERSAPSAEWVIFEVLDVEPGAAPPPWVLELRTGTLEVEGLDAGRFGRDVPPWVLVHEGRGGVVCAALPQPTGDVLALPCVPAGKVRLVRPDMTEILHPERWETLLEVEVARGETLRVQTP